MGKNKKTKVERVDSQSLKNIYKTLKQFLMGKAYEPLPLRSLYKRLSLPQEHHATAKEALMLLIKEGVVELRNRKYVYRGEQQQVVAGVLRVHPRGFGFLQPDDNTIVTQDVFVPKHLTKNAVDGDRVEVLVNTQVKHDKGPEGKVVSIIERGRTHLGGSIIQISHEGNCIAYAPLLGMSHEVLVESDEEIKLQEGDRIIMKVLEWGGQHSPTRTQMSHYVGHISDPSCDLNAIVEEYGLRNDIPNKVLKEVKGYGTRVEAKEIKKRVDLRNEVCFTIDPDTAKDFDDALSIKKTRKGYQLIVHIADVSHYVTQGSALDKEAELRCNSTYFPGHVIPMLPHELSSHLCSLKPNVNRLAASISMDFDNEGALLDYTIARSVIKSKKRFTYTEAKEVLDGKKKGPFRKELELMVELTALLKKQRYNRGSVEFAFPELMVCVDKEGETVGLKRVEYDITHQLVEEFMLKTNEVIATHMSEQNKFIAYRIHEEPSKEDLKNFSRLVRAFGFKLNEEPSVQEVQALFDHVRSTKWEQHLALAFIKSMRLAYYSPDNIGHYGLCLEKYCHFTSPIRRYIDLVIHRALFGAPYKLETLKKVSEACSTQERMSARAETTLIILKKLRYLGKIIDKDPYHEFDAVVTKVKPFGVYFEVIELMLEGFLHISELDKDYFIYEERVQKLVGDRTGITYQCGTPLQVMVASVNFLTLESEWYIPYEHTFSYSKKKKRSKKGHKK